MKVHQQQPSSWEEFKASPNPLAKAREVKAAVGHTGPGLNALYKEWRSQGTMLGIEVLEVAGRPYLPRQAVVDRIEGR